MAEFTADQIEAGIARALREGDIPVVDSLLRLLAVTDPQRAEDVVDTMRMGVRIASGPPMTGTEGTDR